jgi:hypothetical protein
MKRLVILGLVLLSGCAALRDAFTPAPEGRPAGRDGWLLYTVGALEVQVPSDWKVRGDTDRVTLTAPDDSARLEVARAGERFGDEKTCLVAAEEALKRGESSFQRVRRHPTKLADRPAIVQEADQDGWHGWGYAVCDGGVQYRLFFAGRSPVPKATLEIHRDVVARTRIGGEA